MEETRDSSNQTAEMSVDRFYTEEGFLFQNRETRFHWNTPERRRTPTRSSRSAIKQEADVLGKARSEMKEVAGGRTKKLMKSCRIRRGSGRKVSWVLFLESRCSNCRLTRWVGQVAHSRNTHLVRVDCSLTWVSGEVTEGRGLRGRESNPAGC